MGYEVEERGKQARFGPGKIEQRTFGEDKDSSIRRLGAKLGLCLFRFAGHEPEQVGHAIDELADERAHGAAVFGQRPEAAFGASRGGAGEIERGGGEGCTRCGPAVETEIHRFESGDGGVDARERRFVDLGEFRGGVAGDVGFGTGEFAHEGNEIVLDGFEAGAAVGVGEDGFSEAEGRVEFVEGADGVDLRMAF